MKQIEISRLHSYKSQDKEKISSQNLDIFGLKFHCKTDDSSPQRHTNWSLNNGSLYLNHLK